MAKKKEKPLSPELTESLLKGTSPIPEDSLISPELVRFQAQVIEMLTTLESIKLMEIVDIDERLKAAKTKLEIELKVPTLIAELDNLRNKHKVKLDDIKGNKNISPLETGELD